MNRVRASIYSFEEELIEHVKNKPAIWKKSDPNHTNAIIVANNWTSIYDQLLKPCPDVTDGVSCAKKWKQIWSQWLAFKRKTKGRTGQAGGRKPTFRHELSMRYFDDTVEIENMSSVYSNVQDEEDAVADNASSSPRNVEVETRDENSDSPVPGITSNVDLPGLPPTPKTPNNSASKKPKLDPFGEQLLEVVKGRELNEFQHFCSAVAIKMNKIATADPRIAIRLQSQINSLVGEAEIEAIYK